VGFSLDIEGLIMTINLISQLS